MTPPIDHIARLIAEVRADAGLAPLADDLAKALQALDQEADGNDHAAALWEGIVWIVRQPRSTAEKVDVICKLVSQKGFVRIASMRQFSGWS